MADVSFGTIPSMDRGSRGNDGARGLLAAIVQSSDDAIVSKTLDGVITSWNPAAEKLFGYSAAEAIGQPITIIVPPDRLYEEAEIIARIRQDEGLERLETVRVTKDGRRIPLSITVSPVHDETGEVIGASKIARDMTEQLVARETRARLAALVDSSDDAIIGMTLAGRITSWNRGAEGLFGHTAEEVMGRRVTLIIPAERRAEADRVLTLIARGERVEHFETVRVTKDGRLLNVSLTVSPIRDVNGSIIGASKISRDITERVRAEAERADLLAREQAAREEAEALNRSKDQFLAVLSHELRTPLNAIYGWARMLHDGTVDATLRTKGTDAILRNAKAQLQLVEDLLDVSRIITGNMRLDVEPTDIKAVIEAALETVGPAARAKDLVLHRMLDPATGTVLGAPARLQQVVWNLLMNAVKFTPREGRIEVRLRRAGANVEIIVSDTGEGIQPDVLPHIFERFRQGDSSTTRTHGGLGIGLSLVRHLLDLHGGTVHAESGGPGLGSTFTVTLPAAPAAANESGRSGNEDPEGVLHGVRVLVVDDDADGLELARVILARAGADVRACGSSASARDVLAGWPADVLVVDIEMPGEDGYAFVQSLRDCGASAPVIALTAYGRAEDRRRALASGFTMHLTKPVDPAALTSVVAAVAPGRD